MPAAALGMMPIDYTTPVFPGFDELEKLSPTEDDFWAAIQQSWQQNPAFINLENGYFSPQPLQVLHDFLQKERMINEQPSFYMRRLEMDDTTMVRKELATFAHVPEDEIALIRNTTEGLDIIIHGLPMNRGDEIIMAHQDYGSMLEALAMKAQREGTVNKFVSLPLHPANDEEIVAVYEKAITPKTKAMLVTHMINTTGQLLPVRKICDMAHTHGVEVLVDGAHTFAHIDFKIKDLNCDYYAASLHKWLCCPPGCGILWMKKEKVEKIWPLFGDTTYPATDMRKFEHYGTFHRAFRLAIPTAIKFHNTIGSKRKEFRLRQLKNYWVNGIKDIKGITFNTPIDDHRTGGIANFALKGYTPTQLADKLYNDYKIYTVAIESKEVNGVRVTPHLYTTFAQLDAFIKAVKEMAGGK